MKNKILSFLLAGIGLTISLTNLGSFAFAKDDREYTPIVADWPAAMGQIYSPRGMCSASAITRKHILTAAHCVLGNRFYSDIRFYPHVYSQTSPGFFIEAVNGRTGPFRDYDWTNDWAVLELRFELPAAVHTLPLAQVPNRRDDRVIDERVIVAGYPSDFGGGNHLVHESGCSMFSAGNTSYFRTDCRVVPGNSGGVTLSRRDSAVTRETTSYIYGIPVGVENIGTPGNPIYVRGRAYLNPVENFISHVQDFVNRSPYRLTVRYFN